MKFLVLLLLSFSVFAKLPIANISGFSGSYDDPSGQAQAASFRFEDIAFDPNASFAVEKQAGVFLLQTPDQEVEIDSIPSFINDLETLNWSGISLQSNDSTIDLEIQRLNGQNSERKVNLKGLKIS